MTMSHARIAVCTMALFFAPLCAAGHAAAMMAADQGGGYAGLVMEKVAKTWQAPQYPSEHTVRVQVRIGGEGEVQSCTPVQSSNLALLDKSACAAVNEIKKYPLPPYGMPIDVFLTFWTGLPSVGNLGDGPDKRAMAAQATRNEQQASAATASALALARAAEARAAAASKSAAKAGGAAKTGNAAATVSPGTSLSPRGTPPATPVTTGGTDKSGLTAKGAPAKGTPAKGASQKLTAAAKDPAPVKAPVVLAKEPLSPKAVEPAKEAVPATPPASVVQVPVLTAPPAGNEQPASTASTASPDSGGRIVLPKPAQGGQPTGNLVGVNAEAPTAEEARYARSVRWTIREAMLIPAELPVGDYTFTIYVRLSETGQITKADMTYSSGNPLMDKYAMRGIKRVQGIPPPPAKKLRDLHLTFVVQRS